MATRRLSRHSAFGPDANRFDNPHPELSRYDGPTCSWHNCRAPQFADTPVCLAHAMLIGNRVFAALKTCDPATSDYKRPEPLSFVYYLMVGPTTVKIGTTTNLPQRLISMRTDAQYVVALERGHFPLERQRHKEFAAERIGRREDFVLSDALKAHIDALIPQRDELIEVAMALPPHRRVTPTS